MPRKILDKGSTYRFRPKGGFRKDGDVWDLTGIPSDGVTILFLRPDDTLLVKTAEIDNASLGTVHYDNATTDIDMVGVWSYAWRIQWNNIDVTSEPPFTFTVNDSPRMKLD